MEDKQIEAVKSWSEPNLIQDIQVFIIFANFYQRFIQGFSKIAVLLILILKTIRSFKELALKAFKANKNKVVKSDNKTNEMIKNLSKSKKLKNNKSKNLIYVPIIRAIGKLIFLTPDAKEVFNHLRQAFIKALILRHFDLKNYI